MKARTTYLDKKPTQIDWARLAAFIDGEGCIYVGKTMAPSGAVKTVLFIRIANTDPRLMTWLTNNFGGSVHKWSKAASGHGQWSVGFQWVVGTKHAAWVLENCLTFFVIKRDQAEVGLAHQTLCGYQGCAKRSSENIQERLDLRDKLSTMKGRASRRRDLFTTTEVLPEIESMVN